MLDLEELRSTLQSRQGSWSAGPTRYAALDPARLELLAGAVDVPIVTTLSQASGSLARARPSTDVPPANLDWRDNGGNWVTPVREQDLCRSCVAFAICAVMESRLRILEENADLDVTLAPGPLFFRDHPSGCTMGRRASDLLINARDGVGLERDAPYAIDDQRCLDVAPFARVTRVMEETGDARARKFFVADHGPVYAEMRLFDDVYSHTGGVYRHLLGENRGLHAVAIIGFDDARSCWIVKNSWGEDMHEAGFLRIAYGECEIDERPFVALDVERVVAPAA